MGKYANNESRTEDRHWSDLKAYKLGSDTIQDQRPTLGRPKSTKTTSASEPLQGFTNNSSQQTGPPEQTPFTGFKPNEIPQRKNLLQNLEDPSWEQAFIKSIDFSTPPPTSPMWSASPTEIATLNQQINFKNTMGSKGYASP